MGGSVILQLWMRKYQLQTLLTMLKVDLQPNRAYARMIDLFACLPHKEMHGVRNGLYNDSTGLSKD